MTAEIELIRSAVLASLKNDRKLDGSTDETASGEREQETAAKTAPVIKTATTNEKQVVTKTRKQKIKPDENWKLLKKTLQKSSSAKPGIARRKRIARNTGAVKGKDGVQPRGGDESTPSAAAVAAVVKEERKEEAFSAFMKRAVRSKAEPTSVVAMDCEMVGVGPDGQTDALARVSVVNYAGDVLYDSFVRPGETVTDYRTQWSGVRASDVCDESAAVSAFEAQRVVGELLHGRVVVGHALKNDFRVLRIAHPWQHVRDTSAFYKKQWRRRGGSKPALRLVVAKVLGVDSFQKNEHDSCEDARAALELYKKNAKDWERSIREGDAKRSKRSKPQAKAKADAAN